jgi:hypothetical protein
MKRFQKVFILGSNRDDSKPLFIDYNDPNIDWIALAEFVDGTKPIQDYVIANFTIKKPQKMLCDFYYTMGRGVVSKRLLALTDVFDSFKKFPVQINSEDFFILTIDRETDCFDRANSVCVSYDETSKYLGSIAEYTFFDDKVDANQVFSIPQYHYMYCTDVVKRELEQKAHLGFSFIEIYDVTTGRVPI